MLDYISASAHLQQPLSPHLIRCWGWETVCSPDGEAIKSRTPSNQLYCGVVHITYLYRERKLIFSGSIHKLRHLGRNDTDFHLSEFRDSAETLAGSFSLNPSQIEVGRLEIGVNLTLNHPPANYYNALESAGQGVKFSPMERREVRKSGWGLGVHCNTSAYRLKAYAKGDENESPLMLRLETQQQANKLHLCKPLTLATLSQYASWVKMGEYLYQQWERVKWNEQVPEMRLAQLPPKECQAFCLHQLPPESLAVLQSRNLAPNPRAHKEALRRANKRLRAFPSLRGELLGAIKAKAEQLTAG
jgi:hypothetical protein